MHTLWIIIIGFIAGVIAKLVTPGENEPQGFILTTLLGIVGAFVASYVGRPSACTAPISGPGSLERLSARCSFYSSGGSSSVAGAPDARCATELITTNQGKVI